MPSLRFSQKGLSEHYGTGLYTKITASYYLTLPLNVAYSLRPDGQGAQVVAGPYVAMLLGGNYHSANDRSAYGGTSSAEGAIEAGDTYPIPPVGTTGTLPRLCRRFDVGLQAGLGYRAGRLLAQVAFSFGLNDLSPLLPRACNRPAQASLSYLLTPRP